MRVRWVRLREIATELSGRDVQLHASTSLPGTLRAAVDGDSTRADIALNMTFAKSEKDVVDSLAHEVAHLRLGTNIHDNAFQKEWDSVRDSIEQRLKQGVEKK